MTDSSTINNWTTAPRLNAFASFFEETASGRSGMPDLGDVLPDIELIGRDLDCRIFLDSYRRLWGAFDAHYFASIPFRLEEEARLGSAVLRYIQNLWAREERAALVYTLGAGTGCLARTLARIGDGRALTLNCSPTPANRVSFHAKRGSEHAHFFLGSFFELDASRYASDPSLQLFKDGFDVLIEDTTFQMYGPDRAAQVAFIAPRIRRDGVLIQVEKISHPDPDTYARRERQKDEQFKSRYFSRTQIDSKKSEVLNTMEKCEVSLDTSIAALSTHFSFSAVTWNSGNFYTIVSSNSLETLGIIVQLLIPPAIPLEFCYEKLPRFWSYGVEAPVPSNWGWRSAKRPFQEI
ncbi:tRNA (cmo5U34)-methyltransferase [Agrobacterium larrymoorei]|uniref:tRNA (Cmo5U34)-methyltransferase n=1 Tax=Agrobacterium larrymoorei TaxID=160699 RepID=A0AAJ2B6Y2_9HYPH|nr:class I SAM-dependent methyltransferase [Agrobacterium larrymoorei]MDR6100486.1 tRNA (cmo5U34)-methyltransferase [Agrobacterium larrymoorei]